MRLIDADKLEQRISDDVARIMCEDLYGKDRQRLVRGLQRAAEMCHAMAIESTIDVTKCDEVKRAIDEAYKKGFIDGTLQTNALGIK